MTPQAPYPQRECSHGVASGSLHSTTPPNKDTDPRPARRLGHLTRGERRVGTAVPALWCEVLCLVWDQPPEARSSPAHGGRADGPPPSVT